MDITIFAFALIMSPFLQLIQTALGLRDALGCVPDETQWRRIMDIARKQALLGIAFKGIEILPPEQQPPIRIKLQWALAMEKISDNNKRLDAAAAEITGKFNSLGIRSCVLKGQGTALLYPWPEARQSGDIDLWIDLPCRKAVPLLREKWPVGEVVYHHANVKAFSDGTELEIHFRPSWMNNPISNRRIQRYFTSKSAEQFSNSSGKGFNVPTPAFNCIYSLTHIFRHLLQEGVGMRQLLDYYYILTTSSEAERNAAFTFLKSLRMERFCGALMYVLHRMFGLEHRYMLCKENEKYGVFLLDEVKKAGNFGLHDSRNKYRKSQPLPVRFYHRMTHLARFTGIAWSEVLWAPYFKTRQFIWRKINSY